MSDTMRTSTIMLLAATLAAPVSAHAQDREARAARIAELGARIDSLNAEYRRIEMERNAAWLNPSRPSIDLDTTRIGPLLLIAPAGTDVEEAAEAVGTAWSEYEQAVGSAAARLSGIIVTRALPSEEHRALGGRKVQLFDPWDDSRSVRLRAAHVLIGSMLTDALPAATHAWLATGHVSNDARLEKAYRVLALMPDRSSQECLSSDVQSCLDAIDHGHEPARYDSRVTTLRASLLAYALQRGGSDAFARLFDDTANVDAQLENAAQMPLDRLVADWSASVQRARPNVRAAVVESGLWTLGWLMLLAVFATRSTRWRMG